MGEAFSVKFVARWSDMDSNGHMANTAYMEYAVQTRFLYLEASGFGPKQFHEHGMGPVVFRDEVTYWKELRMLDEFAVTFWVAMSSDEGMRFTLKHDILRADGQRAAHITTDGAWFDLRSRKLTPAPPVLAAAMQNLLIEQAT